MKRSRDPLALSPNWHVDLRIESELPEDTVIGTRFLVHIGFSAGALAAVLFAGYHLFIWINLGREIRYWEQRINDNRSESADITRMQRDYSVEAIKIDQAHSLVQPQLYVSDFIANIGRTRPGHQRDWRDLAPFPAIKLILSTGRIR